MTPEQLKPIVEAWGGIEAFAAAHRIKPRQVYNLLSGSRAITPVMEELIRLKDPRKRKPKQGS